MQRYIARRVLHSVLAILAMSVIVFTLARITGNPLDVMLPLEATREDYERVSKHWGLDQPLLTQYVIFLGKALGGDFGYSWKWPGHSAMGLVWQRLPATLQLAGFALLISVVIALPIGVLAAVMKGTVWDSAAKIVALLGQSLPAFWLGIVLMWVFAVHLGWFPTSGKGGLQHMVLPAITLGWFQVAALMRLVRSSMLEVLRADYIRTARAKGLSERKVIGKHALRNSIIPVVTYVGIGIGILLGGAVITETIFQYPGVGYLLYQAILDNNNPVIMAITAFAVIVFVALSLLVDILYAYLDPRIRLS